MVKDKFGVYATELFAQQAERIIEEHDPAKVWFSKALAKPLAVFFFVLDIKIYITNAAVVIS